MTINNARNDNSSTRNISRKIRPCLWFDRQAEEAARFYVSVFENSRIERTTHYIEAGQETHGMPAGTVMTVDFVLGGSPFQALNGGPHFKFSPAISFVVDCETQDEVDDLWARLTDGGTEERCGWLQDRFGVSWQIVPAGLDELFAGDDEERAGRAMNAMLAMKKLDINELRAAAEGQANEIGAPAS